jgi:hypothetical protein
MTRPPHVSLADLLTSLAAPAIEVERLLGASGMRASQWQFTVSISVAASQDTGYAVKALPVNLGFAIAHSETVQNSSSISVNIELIPPSNGRK